MHHIVYMHRLFITGGQPMLMGILGTSALQHYWVVHILRNTPRLSNTLHQHPTPIALYQLLCTKARRPRRMVGRYQLPGIYQVQVYTHDTLYSISAGGDSLQKTYTWQPDASAKLVAQTNDAHKQTMQMFQTGTKEGVGLA